MPSKETATSKFPNFLLPSLLVITTKGCLKQITRFYQQRYILIHYVQKDIYTEFPVRPNTHTEDAILIFFVSAGKP
jgi:hypothetical protein